MTENVVTTKSDLLAHIQRDWSAINALLDSLSDTQWTAIKNADNWTIKDHVAHLSAWEQSVIAFLTGVARHQGLQISEELYLSKDIDAMNHAIFQLHQHDPLDQVRSKFASTHTELLKLIEPLTDEDLNKPYIHFLPDEPGEGEGPLAIIVINNNTADHYRDHQEWIEAMLV